MDLEGLSARARGDGSLDLELKLDGKPPAPLTYARGKIIKGKPVDWSCLNLLAGGPDIFVGTTLDRDNWNTKSGIQARFTYSRGCLSSEVRAKPDPIVWEWKGRRRTLRQPVASALCYTSPDVTPSAGGTTPALVVRSRANGKVLARIPLKAKTARGTVEIEFRSTYVRDGYEPDKDPRDAYLLVLAQRHAAVNEGQYEPDRVERAAEEPRRREASESEGRVVGPVDPDVHRGGLQPADGDGSAAQPVGRRGRVRAGSTSVARRIRRAAICACGAPFPASTWAWNRDGFQNDPWRRTAPGTGIYAASAVFGEGAPRARRTR